MNATLVLNLSSPTLQGTETTNNLDNTTLRICVTAIVVVIIVLTILGNGLVCLAFYRQPHLRGVSYYPILNLALADILCGICAMPAYIAKKHTAGGDKERITCDVSRFTYFISMYASILSVTVVGLERFIAIKMPIRHRTLLTERKMVTALMLSWLEAALVSMLPFVWQRKDIDELCTYQPTKEWSMMVILLNVCFPFVVMFACHFYTVYFAIRFSRAKYRGETTGTTVHGVRRNTSDGTSYENKEAILAKRERDLTCTMAMVLGAFILCWAPSSFYYFLRVVCPQCYQPSFEQVEPVFNAVMKLLTFVNCCINPMIYCSLNKHLREAIYLSLLKKSEARKRNFIQIKRIDGKTAISRGL
ncbi:histamine H2 receptor-like [Paramuricea clavata]|uniref:Histamine H2 receptor-like n=1 Tax=Paramuricea clavata TaxID=317549 RepID=A0A7D9DWN5_PARCT|nr:histamine H2 receptor-like [Paramuricea clavata]